MGYRSAAEALLRRKYLEDVYDRMTDEEKRIFVQMTMQDRSRDEIMQALQKQREQLDDIKKGQNWTRSFGSDLLANFTSAGVLWLGSKLLGKV